MSYERRCEKIKSELTEQPKVNKIRMHEKLSDLVEEVRPQAGSKRMHCEEK